MTPAIHINGLVHTYREAGLAPRTVLDIATWQVAQGEQVLIQGKSGSGKTTLFNILSGLLTATSGSVTIVGQDLRQLTEAHRDRFRARHIGYIFQTHNLLALPAIENVEMPLAFLGVPAKLRRLRTLDALTHVGLAGWARHYPQQLSAGQRLRVAIARALVTEPQVLLADEPTAALDSQTAQQIMDLIQHTCRTNNATLIVASHDVSLTSRFESRFDLRDASLYPMTLEQPVVS